MTVNSEVTVHSLNSGRGSHGNAWMSVKEKMWGGVGVIVSAHNSPTFLIGTNDNFTMSFMQFDDADCVKDYMTKHQNYIAWVKEVVYDKVRLPAVRIEDRELVHYLIDRDSVMCPAILGEEPPKPREKLADVAYGLKLGNAADNAVADTILSILLEM